MFDLDLIWIDLSCLLNDGISIVIISFFWIDCQIDNFQYPIIGNYLSLLFLESNPFEIQFSLLRAPEHAFKLTKLSIKRASGTG